MSGKKANGPLIQHLKQRVLGFLYKITKAKPTLSPSDSWATEKMRPTLVKMLLENLLYQYFN